MLQEGRKESLAWVEWPRKAPGQAVGGVGAVGDDGVKLALSREQGGISDHCILNPSLGVSTQSPAGDKKIAISPRCRTLSSPISA